MPALPCVMCLAPPRIQHKEMWTGFGLFDSTVEKALQRATTELKTIQKKPLARLWGTAKAPHLKGPIDVDKSIMQMVQENDRY